MAQFKDYQDYIEKKTIIESCGGRLSSEMVAEGELLRLAEEQQKKESAQFPIFSTLKANSKFAYSDELMQCITETVDALLENGEGATEPVLLLGNIQCGKTNAFENIMGLAMDRGVDICIVLTKGTKALAEQTKKRLEKDFRPFRDTGRIGQTVVQIHDAIEMVSLAPAEVNNSYKKHIIVCKKQKDNLDRMLSMFNESHLKGKRLLIVDDEADFASRNYRKVHHETLDGLTEKQLDLAKISQQIDELVKTPIYCRYLQVTATPYSLLLQPNGEIPLSNGYASPFKPRFVSEVPIHDQYIGGKQYFEEALYYDSMYSHLFHYIPEKCREIFLKRHLAYVNNGIGSQNAADIVHYLLCYLMATAIRRLQDRHRGYNYLSSSIVHVGTRTKEHEWESELLAHYLNGEGQLRDIFLSSQGITGYKRVNDYCTALYDDFQESSQKGKEEKLIDIDFPAFNEVIEEMKLMFKDNEIRVQVVNGDNDASINALLDETGQLKLTHAANIFIGGFNIDRGITIEHLICTFYGRDAKSVQQNTVMQHARWYGSRSKEDMAVTRIYTTPRLYSILAKIHELDCQMREWVKRSRDDNELPFFVGYEKGIRPCSTQQIIPANTITLKRQKRILPVGFQTKSKTDLNKTKDIEKIDSLITSTKGYKQDEMFVMDCTKAAHIISIIRNTYDYSSIESQPYEWNEMDMIGSMLYGCEGSDGKILVLHRTDRKMNRKRKNGNFIDAPDDGNTDLSYARAEAIDIPVLMLIRENGQEDTERVGGIDRGWRGHAFYWPVLVMPQNMRPSIFTIGQRDVTTTQRIIDASILTADIDPDKILHQFLSIADFEDYRNGKRKQLAVDIDTKNIAAKLLEPGAHPSGRLIANHVDGRTISSIFTHNKGVFPFVVKDFDYILFNTSRDNTGDRLLVQLKEDESKYSIGVSDRLVEEDVIEHYDGSVEDFADDDLAVWKITYKFSRVCGWLRVRNTSTGEPELVVDGKAVEIP